MRGIEARFLEFGILENHKTPPLCIHKYIMWPLFSIFPPMPDPGGSVQKCTARACIETMKGERTKQNVSK